MLRKNTGHADVQLSNMVGRRNGCGVGSQRAALATIASVTARSQQSQCHYFHIDLPGVAYLKLLTSQKCRGSVGFNSSFSKIFCRLVSTSTVAWKPFFVSKRGDLGVGSCRFFLVIVGQCGVTCDRQVCTDVISQSDIWHLNRTVDLPGNLNTLASLNTYWVRLR